MSGTSQTHVPLPERAPTALGKLAATCHNRRMLTRKLGSLLRGQATPFQIIAASVLGYTLGLMPSFEASVGLSVLLVILILILNTNLFVVAIASLLGKVSLLVLMPATFHLGRVLIDSPLEPLFAAMVNAPVLALFGFEYYATTGGLVLGVLIGTVLGVALTTGLSTFRKRMAGVETGSARYQKWSSNKPLKALTWVVFGKKGKKSYAELAERKGLGNPVRLLGVVAAVLVLMLGTLVFWLFSEPLVTAVAKDQLERMNRATVDLESVQVDLAGGRLTVRGLAMADPNALDEDLFRASVLEADVSTADLLRKRVAIDNVEVSDAASGVKRATPGWMVHPRKQEPPAPPETGQKTLEDYLRQARDWKRRLEQAREWIEKAQGPADPDEQGEPEQTFEDWLEREIALKGYGKVRAGHLIQDAPTVLVRRLSAQGMKVKQLPGETLNVTATNLSTHPSLVGESPRVDVTSSGPTLVFGLTLPVATPGRDRADVTLLLRGLSLDAVAGELVIDGQQPIRGGTYDIDLNGTAALAALDLPLRIMLRNTTLTIPGVPGQPVTQLPLTVGLRGSMSSPGLVIDSRQLADALMAAGADQLAARARGEAEKLAGEQVDKIKDKLKDKVGDEAADKVQGLLRGLPGRAKPKPDDE